MKHLGYHASHEQFAPSHLLRCAVEAERAGLAHAMCSDHFAPFSESQGHSGYAWSWLGAALQATSLTFGTVTAPGQRYHPAIVAQAAATLAEMFPGRFWVALGSGENINEHITADRWPPKPERQKRLRECVDVMRALFAGDTVTHAGLVRVDRAKLYTRPATPPPLIAAAVSAETAAWAGAWADGLVTVNQSPDALRRVVEAFRDGGGGAKPLYLQVHVCIADTEEAALAEAHDQWRAGAFAGELMWDVPVPAEIDMASKFVRPEDVRGAVRVSTDLAQQLRWVEDDRRLGFERVYLHHVGRDQRRLLDALAAGASP